MLPAAGVRASKTAGGAKREIGDCYAWGSLPLDGRAPKPLPTSSSATALSQMNAAQPEPLPGTGSLDVWMAASGTSHAALVTRGGELYTWGSGRSGCLGHGSTAACGKPSQVRSSLHVLGVHLTCHVSKHLGRPPVRGCRGLASQNVLAGIKVDEGLAPLGTCEGHVSRQFVNHDLPTAAAITPLHPA